MKLKELTQKQIDRLPEIRKHWLKIGLSTEPCDFDKASEAIDNAYRIANLEPPKIKLIMPCPVTAAMAVSLLKNFGDQVGAQVGAQVRAQVWAQVWAQVRDQVGAQVRAQVWAQVWAQVGAQVGAQVWAQVRDQVWAQVWEQVGEQVRDQVWEQVWEQVGDQVGAQVRAQVWAQVWEQVGEQVGDQVGEQVYGSMDAGWLSNYAAFDEFGIQDCKKLRPLMDLAKCCGWWAPYENLAVIQHRPKEIRRDDFGRLHSEDGPAISYRDFSPLKIWAIHGVRVPAYVVENPETITVELIKKEQNGEIRRIMLERFGVQRFVEETNAELVHFDEVAVAQNDDRKMPRALFKLFDDSLWLYGTDGSTKRAYWMPVQPNVKTCREAHQSICGIDETLCVAQS